MDSARTPEPARTFSYLPSLDHLPPGARAVPVPYWDDGAGSAAIRFVAGREGDARASVRVWGMSAIVVGGHVGCFLGTVAPSDGEDDAPVEATHLSYGALVLDIVSAADASPRPGAAHP
jgi:hypothetical protein